MTPSQACGAARTANLLPDASETRPAAAGNGDFFVCHWTACPSPDAEERLSVTHDGVWIWRRQLLISTPEGYALPTSTEAYTRERVLAWFVEHSLPIPDILRRPPVASAADPQGEGGPAGPPWDRLATAAERSAEAQERLADAQPVHPKIVETGYVARALGLKTTTRVAQMAAVNEIPRECVVPGTGNGKPWKFFREKIDRWIKARGLRGG